jgi:predicted metalloendopeptidase
MVDQASEFEVHGVKVQGKLTCGENIADLGGLRLALRALKAQPGFDSAPLIGGYTQTQRFFLAWATAWRQNIGKERAMQVQHVVWSTRPSLPTCTCCADAISFHALLTAYHVGSSRSE